VSAPPEAKCGIAARRGFDVDCPEGGCALLVALGFAPAPSPGDTCPIEEIASRAGFDPGVVRTLDELREELERTGTALSFTRAARSRDARHAQALRRWPESR
jgi:hypothetical protein